MADATNDEQIVAAELAGQTRWIVRVSKRTRKGVRKAYLTLNGGTLFKDCGLASNGAWLSVKSRGWHRADVEEVRFDDDGVGHLQAIMTVEPHKKATAEARP